ncbi:aspartokinase [Alphaproteobacteria bacterium]|nr:aspartokinase [Alphaproteobacteria bacterium]GHT00020.1 aspartokinase [Alphaproteobacteria bacterium]
MTLVLKFGGTSVANISRIRHVARVIVQKYLQKGERVAVVVSAMAGLTDQLSHYLQELNPKKVTLEDDVVLSSGEPITTALLAIALTELGYPAQSFLGWQLPIVTNGYAQNARILNISAGNLHACFDAGHVPIVAGFQGITETSRLTTLGRGGSDATTVALAVILAAERCDIFTDVEGVYTADPRIVPSARKISTISYEEMLELAFCGTKVLQARSVELAMRHAVPLRVLSSFVDQEGTDILKKELDMETFSVSGITSQENIVKFDVACPVQENLVLADFLSANMPLDLLFQNQEATQQHLSFLVETGNAEKMTAQCDAFKAQKKIADFQVNYDVVKVSVVALGMASRPEAMVAIFKSCAENAIPLLALQTTPLRLSFITTKPNLELAIYAMHSLFEAYQRD